MHGAKFRMGKGVVYDHQVLNSGWGKEWFMTTTEYIFYCKRAMLFLSFSKILTPLPPFLPASLSSPCNKGGGYTLAGRRGGWGVNVLEDERNRIALLQ
jgi:hypothetical protein